MSTPAFALDSDRLRTFAAEMVEDCEIDQDFELADTTESELQHLLSQARAASVITGPDDMTLPIFVDWDETETDIVLSFEVNVSFTVGDSRHVLTITTSGEEPRKIGDRRHRGTEAIVDFLEFAVLDINEAIHKLNAYTAATQRQSAPWEDGKEHGTYDGYIVELGSHPYAVLGRVTVFGQGYTEDVLLCKSSKDVYMTCIVRDGKVTGAPLTSLSFGEVLAGFTVRCGTPLRRVFPG